MLVLNALCALLILRSQLLLTLHLIAHLMVNHNHVNLMLNIEMLRDLNRYGNGDRIRLIVLVLVLNNASLILAIISHYRHRTLVGSKSNHTS